MVVVVSATTSVRSIFSLILLSITWVKSFVPLFASTSTLTQSNGSQPDDLGSYDLGRQQVWAVATSFVVNLVVALVVCIVVQAVVGFCYSTSAASPEQPRPTFLEIFGLKGSKMWLDILITCMIVSRILATFHDIGVHSREKGEAPPVAGLSVIKGAAIVMIWALTLSVGKHLFPRAAGGGG